MNNRFIHRSLWFTAGLVTSGLGIGAGATWLLVTRDGRTARRQIVHLVKDGHQRITETGYVVLEKGKETVDRGKRFIEKTTAKITHRLHFAGM